MAEWTFLLWFELPNELDAAGAEAVGSSDMRQVLLERLLPEDPRWVLRRTRMGNPPGYGETQTWLAIISAEGQTSVEVETARSTIRSAIPGSVRPAATA